MATPVGGSPPTDAQPPTADRSDRDRVGPTRSGLAGQRPPTTWRHRLPDRALPGGAARTSRRSPRHGNQLDSRAGRPHLHSTGCAPRCRRQPRPLLEHHPATRPAPDSHAADRPTDPLGDGVVHPGRPVVDRRHRQRGVTGYRVERCQGAGCSIFTQIARPPARPATATPGSPRHHLHGTGCARPMPPATLAPTRTSPPARPRAGHHRRPAPAGLTATAGGPPR